MRGKQQAVCDDSGRTRAYFLSDVHLTARAHGGDGQREKRLTAFLDSIAGDATHLFLLGDILDYWYEYRDVVPKGYVRFFGKLAELSDAGVKIVWLAGNHDIWLFGYFRQEMGIETVDGSLIVELAGRRFFLNHGDTVGKRPFSFRFIQSFFRNRLCQRLFSGIHPRWTVGFAHWWSRHSRASHPEEPVWSVGENPLVVFSAEYLERHPEIDYFIYGHLHIAGKTEVESQKGKRAEVAFLGEWIESDTYAVFDGEELRVEKFLLK